jgi:DNA processing protein
MRAPGMDPALEALLALHLIPEVGPMRGRALIQHFGSAQAVLGAEAAAIAKVRGIGSELAEAIASWPRTVNLAAELALIGELGLSLLSEGDPLYSPLLAQIDQPPLLLYVWGELRPSDHLAIGIVGSREATAYGLSVTKRMSFVLASAGLCVVSGLARGVDRAAHEAALAAGGRSIAVLGSGLGKVYPPENLPLAERIATQGAVLSEYPVMRSADTKTFPRRNRIVAGWSSGLLVTEAPLRSGSLITANQALEAGRSVYAVPGPIDRHTSSGCNRLIQQGAKLITDPGEILEDLRPELSAPSAVPSQPQHSAPATVANTANASLSLEEKILFEALGPTPLAIDQIIDQSGLTAATCNSSLMRLEIKGLINALPGRRYSRRL